MTSAVSIDSVRAQAFEIPTDKPEADGTISLEFDDACPRRRFQEAARSD